jgi:hypothetical protein
VDAKVSQGLAQQTSLKTPLKYKPSNKQKTKKGITLFNLPSAKDLL